MTAPYTHDQALKLCNEFQYLIGTTHDSSSSKIEYIAITPFDELNKQRFFLYYMLMDNKGQEAILKEYKGFLFDVLIIARTTTGDITKEELSTWIARNTVFQDFPLHAAQQQNQAFI